MYKTEIELYEQLLKLKKYYNLVAIKAEFEAEGSSFRDLVRLRRLTLKAGVKLHIKIAGVEAIRDIRDALEIGVDGVIAPMVESEFAAMKFYESIKSIYQNHPVETTINIESRSAIESLSKILDYSISKFDNITIGRTDLSKSYFDDTIQTDSSFMYETLENIAYKIKESNFSLTVGGNISSKSLNILSEKYPKLLQNIDKLETRKVIIPTKTFINQEDALRESLKFEELYIVSKKEFYDIHTIADMDRLTKLKDRL